MRVPTVRVPLLRAAVRRLKFVTRSPSIDTTFGIARPVIRVWLLLRFVLRYWVLPQTAGCWLLAADWDVPGYLPCMVPCGPCGPVCVTSTYTV